MTRGVWLGALCALALAACGRGGEPAGTGTAGDVGTKGGADAGGGTGGGGDTGGSADASGGPCERIALRLRGVGDTEVTQLDARVAAVEVRSGGTVLALSNPSFGAVNLLASGARLLGTVALPQGATAFDFTVTLSGVSVTADGQELALDPCGATVTFPFRLDQLSRDRCHVVLHVDRARSLSLGADAAFLPNVSLHF